MCLVRGNKGARKGAPPQAPAQERHQQAGDVKAPAAEAAHTVPQPPQPAGPAPAYDSLEHSAPPTHDWQTAVPDTSLFPPPPPFFSAHDRSHTNNATEAEAEAGEDWCRQYPLAPLLVLDEAGRAALRSRNIALMQPAGFKGRMSWLARGHWEIHTDKGSSDSCIIGYPPLYVANSLHDPADSKRAALPTTIYYEVKLWPKTPNNSVALGFTALPYPSFRLPGWHRGSLAVHGDDGNRYINDRWGGKDFTSQLRRGETCGIGMTLTPATQGKPAVHIFMTRAGERVGGWDLHEETDAEGDLPVTGLEGLHDLSCAIGTFDAVDAEVVFDPDKWIYREAADGRH